MKSLFAYGFLVICCSGILLNPSKLDAANLTATKDTLSTSRLSVLGTVDPTGTVAGSSNVKLITPAYDPGGAASIRNAITTANIKLGDTLTIGSSTVDYYTVVGIVDTLNFTVSPVLNATDDDANDVIYLISRPTHTFRFTTTSAVLNGSFRILIPADQDGATVWTDGIPDDGGFDFTASPTVTGSVISGSGYSFSAGTGTVSGGAGCTTPTYYHCYDVAYTGTGGVGAVIQVAITTNAPIAPAPLNTTLGTAETYQYIVQNLNASSTVIDSNSGKIALIEPVRVTATVDPTISMVICGADTCTDVEPADSLDGETLSNNTGATSTATSVALGTLDLLAARLQAQKITIATNGAGGYALTAIDDGDMRKGSDTIDDITAAADPATPIVFTGVGTEAYGIHVCGTHVSAATWGTGTATCAGGPSTNEYSGTDSSQVLPLVSYTTGPTAGVATYVMYKANISPITTQGDYSHSISYIATATF